MFSETQKNSSTQCFGTVRQNSFLKIVIPAPSLIPKIFRFQKFSKTLKVVSKNFFGSVRQKTFDWKSVNPSSPQLSIKFLDISFFFWNPEGFPYDVFCYCETSIFRRKVVVSPVFFYPQNFSMPEVFWNIEGTIYKVFRHCETKNFQRIIVISPSYAKNVSIPDFFSETQKVSPTMFFDTVRHQFFDGQLWCPLFFILKNFRC